jgi:hypothetical protein
MNRKILGLRVFVSLAALISSAAASAQEATYDFTGTVTASNIGSIASGITVTGTYTINFGNADYSSDGYSDNGIGVSQPWYRGVAGGVADPNHPVPTGAVFSSTVTAGLVTFGGPLSTIGSFSTIKGGVGGNYNYWGDDIEYTSSSSFTESSFSLVDNTTAAFTSDGLPVLNATSVGTGAISYGTSLGAATTPELSYSIKSLTRASAPEIDPVSAASGLTLLLGGLAVLRGRRKVVA